MLSPQVQQQCSVVTRPITRVKSQHVLGAQYTLWSRRKQFTYQKELQYIANVLAETWEVCGMVLDP